MPSPIGLIGLGAMGARHGRLAAPRRLRGACVRRARPRRSQAFAAEGGVGLRDPAELAARCDIVV